MAEELLARVDSKPMCASGHPLSRFGSFIAGWWCSSCRREFSGRKLLWGCRVCNYDICGSCLARIRGLAKPPRRAPDATAANIPHSLLVGNYDLSVPALVGDSLPTELIPNALEVELTVDGTSVKMEAVCPSKDYKGGFRKVFTLNGQAPCSQLVLKVAKDEADNANEIRAAIS